MTYIHAFDTEPALALYITLYPHLAALITIESYWDRGMWHTNPDHGYPSSQKSRALSACEGNWCDECAGDLYERDDNGSVYWYLNIIGSLHLHLDEYTRDYHNMASRRDVLTRYLQDIAEGEDELPAVHKEAYQSALHQGELLVEHYNQLLDDSAALDWLTHEVARRRGGTLEDYDLSMCLVSWHNNTETVDGILKHHALRNDTLSVVHVTALLAQEIVATQEGGSVQVVYAPDPHRILETAALLLEANSNNTCTRAHHSLYKTLQSARRIHAETKADTLWD